MAGAIWDAIGRALMAGSQTFGNLSEEERQRAEREAERQRLANQFEQQMTLQRDEFAANKTEREADRKERERQRQHEYAKAAVEELTPEEPTSIAQDVLDSIKNNAPEIYARLNVTPGEQRLNVTEGLGPATQENPLGLSQGPAFSQGPARVVRPANLQEKEAKLTIGQHTQAQDDLTNYRKAIAANPNMNAEQRFRLAQQYGQKFDMSPGEEFSQASRLQAQRDSADLARVRLMYGEGGTRNPVATRWLNTFAKNMDDIRNDINARLAVGREQGMSAEQATQLTDALKEENLMDLAHARTEQILGPRPMDPETTQQEIASIDADAQKAGGYWNWLRIVQTPNGQKVLRRKGVDPMAYLKAARMKADAEAAQFNQRQAPQAAPVVPTARSKGTSGSW